ncbi:MAG: HIT domain-containing protein [Candidatus Colwellbacteria bacterium]|nr:HIT domain-containing protein [Candidatus Colwellbacteria bacterium]
MCVFCSIISGEIPSYKLYEDEETLAFLEIDPSSPGHALIIPKKHVEDFMDLDNKLMVPVMGSVQKVAKMIEKALGADNFTIGVNSGKIVGRHVEHVHVHVIPRFPNDEGHYIQGVVSRSSKETLEEVRDKIIKDGN